MMTPKRYKGTIIPVHEYCLFTESRDDKLFYHLLVNPFQHQRISALQEELLARFDVQQTGKRLSVETVEPSVFGITTTTQQPQWYLYSYVKVQSPEEICDTNTNNLYVRCIYWENADTFYKNGVALVGLRTVMDGDYPTKMDFTQFKRV